MTAEQKAEVYRTLSERYGWTAAEIAAMTPGQQLAYLAAPRHIRFGSLTEARAYAAEMRSQRQ